MKSKLAIAFTAVLLVGAQSRKNESAVQEVRLAIGSLNDAFAKRDAEIVRRMMTDEHVAITAYYGGPQSKAEQLKSLPDLKFMDYQPGDLKVTLLTADSALVTYPLNQSGTYKQKTLAKKNYASAVWVRRGGAWLEALYQETPLE